MANILYRKQKEQTSYDAGQTWIDSGNFREGEVLEDPSNCQSDDSRQCRWVELPIDESYYCDLKSHTKYSTQVEECSYDGIIWERSGEQRQGDIIIETYSNDCGYNQITGDNILSFAFDKLDETYYTANYHVYLKDELTIHLNGSDYTVSNSPCTIELTEPLTTCKDMFVGTSWESRDRSRITDIYTFPNTSNVTNMSNMFYENSDLITIPLYNFDTSNVTNMKQMFYNCSGLLSLDVSNFNTTNVTDMSAMFYNCFCVKELDVSNFNTTNVTKMYSMFYNCNSVRELNVSNFNTTNVTSMSNMFCACDSVRELDVSNFNTTNVTNMYSMFHNCSRLLSLDASSFNTTNVTDMSHIFRGCLSLQSINVSSWDVEHVTSYNNMFDNCDSLTSLTVKSGTESWWEARLTDAGILSNVTIISV